MDFASLVIDAHSPMEKRIWERKIWQCTVMERVHLLLIPTMDSSSRSQLALLHNHSPRLNKKCHPCLLLHILPHLSIQTRNTPTHHINSQWSNSSNNTYRILLTPMDKCQRFLHPCHNHPQCPLSLANSHSQSTIKCNPRDHPLVKDMVNHSSWQPSQCQCKANNQLPDSSQVLHPQDSNPRTPHKMDIKPLKCRTCMDNNSGIRGMMMWHMHSSSQCMNPNSKRVILSKYQENLRNLN